MGDDATIGVGGGMMELVDDDVVERIALERVQGILTGQALYGGEDDVCIGLVPPAVQCSGGPFPDTLERLFSLSEDVLRVCDEKDLPETDGVHGREVGLADSGSGNDQCSPHAIVPGPPESVEGDGLRGIGFDEFILRIGIDTLEDRTVV